MDADPPLPEAGPVRLHRHAEHRQGAYTRRLALCVAHSGPGLLSEGVPPGWVESVTDLTVMTRCFGWTNGQPCPDPGTRTDPESRPVFVNPDDPDGPTISPTLCPTHYAELMRKRDDNEASWRRMTARYGTGR